MKKTLLLTLFSLSVGWSYGQSYQETLVHMPELLQYQRQKQRAAEQDRLLEFSAQPFKKLGFKRIHAKAVLADNDPRHVWGYHVNGNREFDKEHQPFHQLFRRGDWGSMVVVDHFSADNYPCELIFWGKKYYRRFAAELRRMGFVLRNSTTQSNILEFRKPETSIGVDVIIWPEIYILQIKSL